MKQSITLVLFFTLLFNETFAHDNLKNRQHSRKTSRSHVEKRDQTLETESSLTINITASIFLALNESSESAAVFDFKSNISAVINSDSVILISYENGSGVYLSQSLFNSRESFEQYFRNLTCLKQLYESGVRNGVSFNVTSASPDISKRVSQILNSLGENLSSSEALENYEKLSQSVSDIFQNSVTSFIKLISNSNANSRGGLNRFIAFLQGLQCFFNGLSDRNLRLDLSKLLNQPSGLHVLNNLLEQIASQINVGQLLGDRLNSPENLFPLLNLLGGNSTEGLNGFIHVIYEVINVNQNHTNVEKLVLTLLEYSGNSTNGNVGQQFLSALQNLQNTLQRHNLGNAFQFLSHLAQNTTDSSSSNNFDISRIVSTLLHFDPQNPINPIVAILLSLRQRVSPEESIPELFEQLISRLNTSNGRQCISNIFPNLNITNGDGIENLLLVGFHIRNFILQGIEHFWSNMADFWSHIPIIGRFYEAIDRALALFTKGAVQLNKIFESQIARPRIERILGFLRRIASREENSSDSGSQGILGNFIRPILNQDKIEHKKGHKERHHHFNGNAKHNKQLKSKHRSEKKKH
ncbi:uncharacterized protein LOC103312210 [Tribolium castaneum]|uniref:Uncharacterized protein n=1 Tax=Tribolium castaneum TaxID=7070 RepID=A0A139WLP0_TRICA|nr:PREDICTED: uncharacterized protein LOC103312210 [Tribolium castaneum]KYB28929.1 hypothetical protein TcasGA2_TC032284 [Tribolium castaneum]|eukprot:XP_008190506.1 PREDICTED: uncharacterized protein LOC103312210 [Tribolium castaneum]